uniref:Uncharacterized protein n=1 Tax=Trichobilharzia regenti TaxID=157069 RepID=A0AA85KJW5_TRIRE|nr:unnamed protein product [Trichobilharzia regenti]
MPDTVSIERHKLNQAMYQKLKRYIMSRRRREQEEKAQDAIVKRLRREREESKRQAEMDTENLENTKKEILVTRKRIEELTTRRNELFQRLKQLASEETSLKEKQKSETMAYLASMPSTQFGVDSNSSGTSSRIHISQTTLPTCAPLPSPNGQHVSTQKSTLSTNSSVTLTTINSGTLNGSHSPHRTHHGSLFGLNGSKTVHTTVSSSAGINMQQPLTSITNNQTGTMAAAAAQQRSVPSDPGFPPTAAAAAYFNVIASLANSSSLAGNSLGINYPNSSVSLAEVVAALAASGLCSLPASISSNLPISSGNLISNFAFCSRASPSNPDMHHTRDTVTTPSSGNMHSGLPYLQNPLQSANSSKNPPVSIHHNPNLDLANTTLDTAKVCLAQLAAAAAAGPSGNNTTGSLINQQNILSSNQQLQKAHQILRSLNVPNPLLSPLLSGNTSELDVSQTTPMSTSTTISSSPLLPPAPISYRGSITTGQSAQQIQLQQQAHQKQQHNVPKYMTQIDYSSARGHSGGQNIDNLHLLPSNYSMNIPTQGTRFTNQQQQQINSNNLIMLNLTSSANHNSIANNTVANITNASKSLQGGRHLENNALRNPNNITTTPVHCNSSSTGITSLTSNTPVATSSIVNNTSSVALAASLAPFAADLNSLNYLTSATLAAAFQQQQQQQQQLSKFMSANNSNNNNNINSSSGHPHSAGSSGPQNNSGRRFFDRV